MKKTSGFVTGVLFIGLVILHIWLGRIDAPISYFSPLLGALLFASYVGNIKDWAKPLYIPEECALCAEGEKPPKRINAFKVLFIMMALGLYFASFADRG